MTPHLSGTPVLETPRLILRALAPQDYQAWEPFFLSERSKFIGGGAEHDSGRAWRAFAAIVGHWPIRGCGAFAIVPKGSDTAIGSCGPWFPALWPEREIGWNVWSTEHEGKGLVAEAARAVVAHAFADLGWDTAVSYIDPDNARSIALAERLDCRLDTGARAPDPRLLVYRHPAPDADGSVEAYA